MTLKRLATAVLLMLLIAGCASAPSGTPEDTPPPVPGAEPPQPGPLPPSPAHRHAWYTATSPDARWVARLVGEPAGPKEIWVVPAGGGEPWLVAKEALMYEPARFLWTPANRLLFYSQYGEDWRDTWLEADPLTRKIQPFVPELLANQSAGRLVPSPDGGQLLVTTGHCYGCNKPSAVTLTTWVLDMETEQWREVGVDVEARWEGNELKVESQPPHMGYSGIIFNKFAEGHAITHSPLGVAIQVGGSDYVEFRVYAADAGPDAEPLRVFPAVNSQSFYSNWSFTWEDSPPGLYRVEAWAEVRPAVPNESAFPQRGDWPWPAFRHEGGRRWAVLYSQWVKVEPGSEPRQTLTLNRLRMMTEREGWGVDIRGRVYLTADGGASWRDVSPPGLRQCDGRLSPRHIYSFAGREAAVAVACDFTDDQGRWSERSGRVQIFRTSDGGRTWTEGSIATGYTRANPAVLQFLDQSQGVALVQPMLPYPDWHARGALYRTRDGGKTWERETDTDHGLPGARQGFFLTPERGWVLGSDVEKVTLHLTEDGGRTWQEVPVDRSAFGQASWVTLPQFVSPTEGFFTVKGWKEGSRLGLQELYATTDGGRSWEKRSSWDGERRPVFLTPQVGYIWEYELHTVYWTRDGGRSWEPRTREINPAGIADLHFINEQQGFAVQGHLWVTGDGGRTWAPLYQQSAP